MGSANNAAAKQNNEVAPDIVDIEDIHRQAILDKQSTYIDPSTDFMVFSELAHLKRGKCCGNQCRHCPYAWTNVRNAGTGGFGDSAADNKARALSGDRRKTGKLVKRILNGTYYEDDGSSCSEATHESSGSSNTDSSDSDSDSDESECKKCDESSGSNNAAKRQASKSAIKGHGKGGSAGGTLTSKNVPYTRKGDAGTSQLFTGERRNKDDILFEALGTVDELCSVAGVVYAELDASQNGKRRSSNSKEEATNDDTNSNTALYGDLSEQLLDVMSRLFDVGSHIAKPTPKNQQNENSADGNKINGFNSRHTAVLEEWIDKMTDDLPELTSFILPTGSPASAQLHIARTVCRRAERRMVPLVQEEETVDPAALAYVNRLSDYFFTAARFANYCDGRDEVQYRVEERVVNDGVKKDAKQREMVVVKLKK